MDARLIQRVERHIQFGFFTLLRARDGRRFPLLSRGFAARTAIHPVLTVKEASQYPFELNLHRTRSLNVNTKYELHKAKSKPVAKNNYPSVSLATLVSRKMRTKPAHWTNVFSPIPGTDRSCSRQMNGPFFSRQSRIFFARAGFNPEILLQQQNQ